LSLASHKAQGVSLLLRGHVWLAAAVMPILVDMLNLPMLMRLLTPPRWWKPYRGASVEQMLDVVERRLSRPINMRRRVCLRRSLVLYHFLLLAGRQASIEFGVFAPSAEDGSMHGHCWVSVDGQAVTDESNLPPAIVYRGGGAGGAK